MKIGEVIAKIKEKLFGKKETEPEPEKGNQSLQTAQEQQEKMQADISLPEREKRQERAVRGQQEEEKDITELMNEIEKNMTESAVRFAKELQGAAKGFQEATKVFRKMMESLKYVGLDKWEIEKLKMSNNERRRRKIPMVRRRAYITAEKIKKRSRKK